MPGAGELLVGPKKTLFLDEISTGLDSSTTFQITRTLREFSHLRDATMLIALLQPTPETYDLFDDIMLLSEGSAPHPAKPCTCTFCFPKGTHYALAVLQGFKVSVPIVLLYQTGLRLQMYIDLAVAVPGFCM